MHQRKQQFFHRFCPKHHRFYPEWELEVQNTIRAFRKPNPESQWAQICVKPGDANHLEIIYSFVWFGILGGTRKNDQGIYTIGYIARSLAAAGCHFGDFTLKHALRILKDEQSKSGRYPLIGARIDPRNESSMTLFDRNGFRDQGVDEDQPSYLRWTRKGFDNIE